MQIWDSLANTKPIRGIYGIQEGALVSWSKIWDRTNRVLLARLKITLVVMLRPFVTLPMTNRFE